MLSTLEDFADAHNVPLRRVKTAIGAGFIPVVKIRSRLRVDLEALPANFLDYLTGDLTTRRGVPVSSFVYFIGPEGGPIKIGVATDPTTRLITLQCGSPVPLQLLATVEGGKVRERRYHTQFAAHRLHGEWFSPHPDILAEIERLAGRSAAQ